MFRRDNALEYIGVDIFADVKVKARCLLPTKHLPEVKCLMNIRRNVWEHRHADIIKVRLFSVLITNNYNNV